jgi:hypothetical protein
MSDVFTVPVSLEDGKPPDMYNTLDLLKTYSTQTLEDITAWTKFVYMYVDEITIENMYLSQTMLLNSCELGLYVNITDEVSLLELKHRGGPMAPPS